MSQCIQVFRRICLNSSFPWYIEVFVGINLQQRVWGRSEEAILKSEELGLAAAPDSEIAY